MIVKSRQQAAGRKCCQGQKATRHELSTYPRAVAKKAKETSDSESCDTMGGRYAENSPCSKSQVSRDETTRKQQHPTPGFEITDQAPCEKHHDITP